MFALVLLGLVASASTAWHSTPWYDYPYYYNNGYQHRNNDWDSYKQIMNNFQSNMEGLQSEISSEMTNIQNQEEATIEGNEYKITTHLRGFNKENIVVKAKKGKVVIQANQNVAGDTSNNYQYVRNLPDYVDENGSWSYNNGVLTIFFPIIQRESDTTRASNLPSYVNSVKEIPNNSNGYQHRNYYWDGYKQVMNDLQNNTEGLQSKINSEMTNKQNQEEATIEGNEYKITTHLRGFNKENIVVKAKKGKVVIQANQNVAGDTSNNYQYVRNLPDYVDENGSWSYNNGVLTIFFPIIQRESDTTRASNLPSYVNSVKEFPNGNYSQGVITGGV